MDGLVINNIDEKAGDPEMYIPRYLTINPDLEDGILSGILKQIKETLYKTGKVGYWAVLENKFLQGNLNRRHLMAISSMTSWAELDDGMKLSQLTKK
ncbi:MAG: hypothetical protein ACI9IA_001249 [Enterobacterales bacterium]|jgi:hypothetical protein